MFRRLHAFIALMALITTLAIVPTNSASASGPTPPEALGLSSHTVKLSTGVTLHYVEKGKGKDNVIIFLHGYTDSWRSFERNLPLISSKYHIYALDQRGHGDSSRPACCYTQADFAKDVVAFMDAQGIKRATLVGHSMGSFIAHKVATDYRTRVDKLVLIGSAPTSAGNEVISGLNEAVQTLEDPVDPAFVRDFQASTFYRPIPDEFLDTAVSESLKLPASVWKQALNGLIAEDHSAKLGRIHARTLIIYGDQDGIFTMADQQALVKAIPHAKLVVYTQTGHGSHVEQPQRFVADLQAFLAK